MDIKELTFENKLKLLESLCSQLVIIKEKYQSNLSVRLENMINEVLDEISTESKVNKCLIGIANEIMDLKKEKDQKKATRETLETFVNGYYKTGSEVRLRDYINQYINKNKL